MNIPASRVDCFTNGDHVCLFYKSPAEQVATVGPFVQVGLLRNERCFCIQNQLTRELLISWLAEHRIDTKRQIERGALVFLEPSDVYRHRADGSLDSGAMVKLLEGALQESLALGFSGFRPTGEVVWELRDAQCCAQLLEYEMLLERYLPGRPAVGLCQYDVRRFESAQLAGILAAHRLALLSGEAGRHAMRLRKGGIFADIIVDERDHGLFHYTVQKDGVSDILALGQAESFRSALSAAQVHLTPLS